MHSIGSGCQRLSKSSRLANTRIVGIDSTYRQGLLNEESLAGVPIAVFGNKIDLPHAASEEELRYALALETSGKVHGGSM